MDGFFGAYGVGLEGPNPLREWLNPAPRHWLRWRIESRRMSRSEPPGEDVGGLHARIRLSATEFADLDRNSRRATLHLEPTTGGDSLVHPHLAALAIVNAYWSGWESFHAGAIVVSGRVWAMLGPSERGKSSALGWVHANGGSVFADDLVVIREGAVMAGPRALDLRGDAAEQLRIGELTEDVAGRRRWRVRLGPVQPEMALAGWVLLRWSEGGSHVRPATRNERLPALVANRALRLTPVNPNAWLGLASAPMVVLERPLDWSRFDQAMAMLMATLDAC